MLPSIGSSASSLVAWAVAKPSSRTPEEFGKGSIEGLWASESSNNANVGGSLALAYIAYARFKGKRIHFEDD
ncbi:tripartite tricarboxylate transporter permease [Devosia sp.]|uniref:tripartite tricarboxylate transporter permease n=1 Tax=Devosia sp. TaxID=1871048 RepID=UPI002EFF86D4